MSTIESAPTGVARRLRPGHARSHPHAPRRDRRRDGDRDDALVGLAGHHRGRRLQHRAVRRRRAASTRTRTTCSSTSARPASPLRGLLDVVPREEMEPGDAFISNDSHTAGSTHPPDVSVITPIFHDGEVVAFAQSQAHLLDIGGMNPGGFAPSAVDCFAEALRMPPGVKCYERGEPVESVRRMIVNNVRLPVIFWNDVRSLVASNNTGARRLAGDDRGVRRRHVHALRRPGDRTRPNDVVAGRIADLPDGVYEAHEWQEGDGKTTDLLPVHCRMTIRGAAARVRLLGVQPADRRVHQLLLRRARRQRRHRDEPDAGVGPAVQPGRPRPGDDRRRRGRAS